MEGAATSVGNIELADQLFLRLAELGPTLLTAGDRNFVPLLARSWTRRDSVTLAFDLDPRARWQDGVPVTARDVVFTFGRARNPASRQAGRPAAADHLGDGRRRAESGVPLCSSVRGAAVRRHLPRGTASGPSAGLDSGRSPGSFVVSLTHPVGSGPYRLVRTVPGQFVELAANPDFFLGPAQDRPGHHPGGRRCRMPGSTFC